MGHRRRRPRLESDPTFVRLRVTYMCGLKEDFAQRVFDVLAGLLSRAPERRVSWELMWSELDRIGPRGIDGLVRALRCPDSVTRRVAAGEAGRITAGDEGVIRQLKELLADPNRKVRRSAMDSLLTMGGERGRSSSPLSCRY